MKAHSILPSALLLGVVAAAGVVLVTAVHEFTEPRVEAHARDASLRRLESVLPASTFNNDILDTVRHIDGRAVGNMAPVRVYLARWNGKPVAAVFDLVTPDGYNGPIRLLTGIYYNGAVSAVRVVSQHETPGFGAAIEVSRSDWIRRFSGRALDDPPVQEWEVARDGGAFDQISGATITSRGVVGAVRRALLYFASHKQALFAPTDEARPRDDQ